MFEVMKHHLALGCNHTAQKTHTHTYTSRCTAPRPSCKKRKILVWRVESASCASRIGRSRPLMNGLACDHEGGLEIELQDLCADGHHKRHAVKWHVWREQAAAE